MSGVKMSGVELSGVETSGVEMSTFGIKIGHFNPRLYNRIYCVIPGVEMSGVEMSGVELSGVEMSGVEMSPTRGPNTSLYTGWVTNFSPILRGSHLKRNQ